MRMKPEWIDARGIASQGRDLIASMGIYLFNRDTLVECLEKTDYLDFGKEIFPASVRAKRVMVHLFDGYWEDIGTIKSFYEANLSLAGENPPFDFHSPSAPIYTPAAVSAADAHWRRGRQAQPRRRRLPDRPRLHDRKQRDRPALHHRRRRHDSRTRSSWGPISSTTKIAKRIARRPAAAGNRQRQPHRRGDSRQELPHRQERADHQRAEARNPRRGRSLHHPRRDSERRQRRRAAG